VTISVTLNDLERQNREFYGFLAISGCDTSLYRSQGGATVLSLCSLQHDCNKGVVFYPEFPQI